MWFFTWLYWKAALFPHVQTSLKGLGFTGLYTDRGRQFSGQLGPAEKWGYGDGPQGYGKLDPETLG